MWVYSANCNVYLYIYIAVGTNPRVVIDCKWHKAHCSVMPCHAAPPAADEWACPPAGAWAGASRVKASVHPTAFRPEATAPPVGVFFTNPRGFDYGCNNSHCYCRRHLFGSSHGPSGCRSHGKTLFNITAHRACRRVSRQPGTRRTSGAHSRHASGQPPVGEQQRRAARPNAEPPVAPPPPAHCHHGRPAPVGGHSGPAVGTARDGRHGRQAILRL